MKTVKSIMLVLIISISFQGCSSLKSFNEYSPLKVKTAQMKKEERNKSRSDKINTRNIKTKGEKIVERVNKTSFGKATNIFPATRFMRFIIKKTYK